MIDIHFLYFEDCPSHPDALARLKQVMAEEGIEDDIRITKVETEDEAQQWRFVGSPTIQINGKDIVPPPPEAPTMLTCRVYQLENGRFSPLPSTEMIRDALQNAKQTA
jgi:hypothetical protein